MEESEILECYNHYGSKKHCRSCVYSGSCRFATENKKQIEKTDKIFDIGTVSFIEMEGYDHVNKQLSKNDIPGEIEYFIDSGEDKRYSQDEVIALISLILRFSSDKVVCAALADKVSTGDKLSNIAKRMGIKRQFLDTKIADQFAKIFGWRQTRVKDASLLKLSTDEFLVYKYAFKKGFNTRKTSEKTGLHIRKVQRIVAKLSKKYNKNVAKNKKKK